MRLTASAPVEEVEEAGEVEEYGEELCASCGEMIASADAVCGSCGGARRQTIAAAGSRTFDESKVRRIARGQHGGGRFTVKENAAGRSEVVSPDGKKVAETTDPKDAEKIASEKNAAYGLDGGGKTPPGQLLGLTIDQADEMFRDGRLGEADYEAFRHVWAKNAADPESPNVRGWLATPEDPAVLDRVKALDERVLLDRQARDLGFPRDASLSNEELSGKILDRVSEPGFQPGVDDAPATVVENAMSDPVEGPFTYPSGWTGRYDPKEGRYIGMDDIYMPADFDPSRDAGSSMVQPDPREIYGDREIDVRGKPGGLFDPGTEGQQARRARLSEATTVPAYSPEGFFSGESESSIRPRDAFKYSTEAAIRRAQESSSSLSKAKAESARRVMEMIDRGEIRVTDADLAQALERMNRVDAGGPDRSVNDMMLEAVQGIAIRNGATRALLPLGNRDTSASAAEELVAAIPVKPPADWFELPKLDAPTPMTITDDGRIYGHAAAWGTCHLGNPRGAGVCVQPPRSQTDYALFHLGEVETDSGARVPVGQITLDTGHAPMGASARTAAAHYDDTGTCVADVVAGEDEHGIVFSGALRPDVTPERARKLMGSKISGDWRGGELVGMLAVNVPGFPIPRARMVASAEGVEEVMTLVAAGVVYERSSVEKLPVETAVKVLAARAEGVEALAALAES